MNTHKSANANMWKISKTIKSFCWLKTGLHNLSNTCDKNSNLPIASLYGNILSDWFEILFTFIILDLSIDIEISLTLYLTLNLSTFPSELFSNFKSHLFQITNLFCNYWLNVHYNVLFSCCDFMPSLMVCSKMLQRNFFT